MTPKADSDLWMCPECGHKFVTRNIWHSCSNYDLEHHFGNCESHVRKTFDKFLEVVESYGPVTIIPQKTRIAIMVKVRFASCIVRKKWLLVNLWLTRRTPHPRLEKTEKFGPHSFGLRFRFDSANEIDDSFRQLVGESYAVGRREHQKDR